MSNITNITNGWSRQNGRFAKTTTSLTIIIVAVLLLELLSAAQYYFTRNMMENELEKRAEMELTMKAIITNG